MKIMVTGFAGFIGSNLCRKILKDTDHKIIGLDAHKYSARPLWVYEAVQHDKDYAERFKEVYCDIRDQYVVDQIIKSHLPDAILHLAAESHVCRSIEGPEKFMETNFLGTFNLLEAIRKYSPKTVFQHISTDEVYGVAGPVSYFTEETCYDPKSPYSASKAASDHLVSSWAHTYGIDTRITNCSNNFGPNQHEEKLIPKTILNALRGEAITLYGQGDHSRDWIWVNDHADGILAVLEKGKRGDKYILGGNIQKTNSMVVAEVLEALQETAETDKFTFPKPKIVHTNDRPTDDARYAVDCSKIWRELGWSPRSALFYPRLKETIRWYRKYEHPG